MRLPPEGRGDGLLPSAPAWVGALASEGLSSGMPWGSLRAPAGRLNGFLCPGDFPPGCAARRGGPAEPCLGLWGWGLRGGFGIA
ncbi:MAG: hypothetical protein KY393_03100 [Actinobacteria bacterium]|nr:hypothetical protein [Actinomycetota bacterium]